MNLFSNKKVSKISKPSCADVAIDATEQKMYRHLANYVLATWRTHMQVGTGVCARVRTYARVCANVCV